MFQYCKILALEQYISNRKAIVHPDPSRVNNFYNYIRPQAEMTQKLLLNFWSLKLP